MNRLKVIFCVLIGICCGALGVRGGEIKVPGDKSDNGIARPEKLGFVGQPNARVGIQTSTATTSDYIVFVMVFKLPDLPANSAIVTADLQFNLETGTYSDPGFLHKVDLYGVRTDSDNKVAGSDYYAGETGGDTQGALMQAGIITKETPAGLVHTDADGGKKLAAWLAGIYKEGGAGQYVFLRLNADVPSKPYKFFMVSTADSPNEEWRPVLTITTK